jgi:energy-converting hydrogenase Eha subunit H
MGQLDQRLVLGITAVSLILLTLVIMYIIPKFVPPDQQDEVSHMTMVSFSLFMMLFSMAQTDLSTPSIINFVIFVILIVLQFTGIYWWIPQYIPKDKSVIVIHWMFVISSFLVILTNVVTTATFKSGTYAIEAAWAAIPPDQHAGGRRRK